MLAISIACHVTHDASFVKSHMTPNLNAILTNPFTLLTERLGYPLPQ